MYNKKDQVELQDDGHFWYKLHEKLVEIRLWIVGVGALFTGIALMYFLFPRLDSTKPVGIYIALEIGKAFLVGTVVSAATKMISMKQSRGIDKALNELKDLKQDTFLGRIDDKFQSLTALENAKISQVFSDRDAAGHFISEALRNDDVTQILVVGVSLNDFLRGDRSKPLPKAWTELYQQIVTARRNNGANKSLDIRLLIVDPESRGAQVRQMAESQDTQADNLSRLEDDTRHSIRSLLSLHQKHLQVIKESQRGDHSAGEVTFNAHVYRTDPSLFLVWTDQTAFVQQYYFRPRHDKGTKIPILMCDSASDIHAELKFHFETVWNDKRLSVELEEYQEGHAHGCDQSLKEADITNVYFKQDQSQQRILRLIAGTEKGEKLWIKGVSLKSFVQNDETRIALTAACQRGVDVQLLLIDPKSEQARIRAMREFQLNLENRNQSIGQDDLAKFNLNKTSLYQDTVRAIDNFRTLRRDIQAWRSRSMIDCDSVDGSISDKNEPSIRIYNSAPESFMLITNQSALIEQYHYGKGTMRRGSIRQTLLGGEVPVIEYRNPSDGSSDENIRDKSSPYEIFVDSFSFSFNHSKDIDDEIDFYVGGTEATVVRNIDPPTNILPPQISYSSASGHPVPHNH